MLLAYYIQQYFESSYFCYNDVWKLLIALFQVLNTGAQYFKNEMVIINNQNIEYTGKLKIHLELYSLLCNQCLSELFWTVLIVRNY